jgi:hypothetical protein
VIEVVNGVVGEVEVPELRVREFKNLDATLDFCKFVQPEELFIKKRSDGSCQLQYINPEGMF